MAGFTKGGGGGTSVVIPRHLVAKVAEAASWVPKMILQATTDEKSKTHQFAKKLPQETYKFVRGFLDQDYHDTQQAQGRSNRLLQAASGKFLQKPLGPTSQGAFARADEISQKMFNLMQEFSQVSHVGTAAERTARRKEAELYYNMLLDEQNRIDATRLAMIREGNIKLRKGYVADYPKTAGIPNWRMSSRPWSGLLTETEQGAQETESGDSGWRSRIGQQFYWWMELPGRSSLMDTGDADTLGGGNLYDQFKLDSQPAYTPVTPFAPGAKGSEHLPVDQELDALLGELNKMVPERNDTGGFLGGGSPSSLNILPQLGTTPEETPKLGTTPEETPAGPKDAKAPLNPDPLLFMKGPDVEKGERFASADTKTMSDAIPPGAGWEMGEQYTQADTETMSDAIPPGAGWEMGEQYTQAAMPPVPPEARLGVSKYHLKHLDNLDKNAEQFAYRENVPEQLDDYSREYKSTYNIVDELRDQLKDPTSETSIRVNRSLTALLRGRKAAARKHAEAKGARDRIKVRELDQDVPGALGRWEAQHNKVLYWQALYLQLEERIEAGEPVNEQFAAMRGRYVLARPKAGWQTEQGDVRRSEQTPLDETFTEKDYVAPNGKKYKIKWGYFINPETGAQEYGVAGSSPVDRDITSKSLLGDEKTRAKELTELKGNKELYDKLSTNHKKLVRSLGDWARKYKRSVPDFIGQIQQWVKFQGATAWQDEGAGGPGKLLNFMLSGGNIPAFERTDAEEEYITSFKNILTDIRNMMDEARISNEDATRVMTALGDPHSTNVKQLQLQVQASLTYLSAKIWLGIGRQAADLSDPDQAVARATGLVGLYGVPKYPIFLFPYYDKTYRDKGPRGRAFRAQLDEARRRQNAWDLTGRRSTPPGARPNWGNSKDIYRDGYIYDNADPVLDPAQYARDIVESFRVRTDGLMEGRTVSEQSIYLFGPPTAEGEVIGGHPQ